MNRPILFLVCLMVVFGAVAHAAQPSILYSVLGHGKNGFYQTMTAPDGTDIRLSRQTRIVNVGGLMVEGDPEFTIKGVCGTAGAVQLTVLPEDILVDLGGIKAVARVDFHVTGTIGSTKVKLTVREDHPVSKVGGMHVQTGYRMRLVGLGSTFEAVSVVQDMGDIKVQTGTYHTLKGPRGTDLRVDDFGQDAFTVSGAGEPLIRALLVALRPFLL